MSQVAYQTRDIHLAFSGNSGHRHWQNPQLQQEHGSRHDTWQKPRPEPHHSLLICLFLTSIEFPVSAFLTVQESYSLAFYPFLYHIPFLPHFSITHSSIIVALEEETGMIFFQTLFLLASSISMAGARALTKILFLLFSFFLFCSREDFFVYPCLS